MPYEIDMHLFAQEDNKRTIQGQRRRPSSSSSGERKRAETPRRRPASSGRPTRPPSGSSNRPPTSPPPSSGGQLPSNINPLIIIGVIVLLVICGGSLMLFSNPDEGEEASPNVAEENSEREIPPTSVPFVPPPNTSGDGQTWLIMLYQDADDKILEQDIYIDLNEAEKVGSSDQVHIVAQVDRFRAGYRGDGNWSSTKRFYVTQDNDLERVNSQEIIDLGEVNMADANTLIDFVTWAIETFPADKHVLIMSDHGLGWPGGWSDPAPGNPGDPSIPLAAALGDKLYLMELDEALAEIRTRTQLEQFELIGMDACLMGHIEVFSALAPHARYAVASQEVEPALGWAYAGFLAELKQNPNMSGADLSRFIIDSYIQSDERIVNDEARAEFLRQGSPLNNLFSLLGTMSAAQLAEQMEQTITLSAIDLASMPTLIESLNDLAFTLQEANQPTVARARTYALSFTNIFGNETPPSYIDLGNFAQLLQQESNNSNVTQAANRLESALAQTVIAQKHGPKRAGASGISIYFPASQLYQLPIAGPESYTAIARRFADVSLWDDFLAYHYTGRSFTATATELVVPERDTVVIAPGSGQIELSPITLSDDVAAPEQPIILSTDISGENIGYIYLFVGFYDEEANSIFVADSDYLDSETTREIAGVYYPDWGEGDFTLEFEWEPIVYAIDDGINSPLALFTPESYGATPEEATYTVEGIYTYGDGGETRYARLYFVDGLLRQVFGFTGEDGTGAPREIIPQTGDSFTILDEWLDLDEEGNVADVVQLEGETFTFTDQTFAWVELDAPIGPYIVGFIVEDLDGNTYEVYEQVTVE